MIKKKISYGKICAAGQIFNETNAPHARLIRQNAPQAGFLTKSSWVLYPVIAVFNFFARITGQNLLL